MNAALLSPCFTQASHFSPHHISRPAQKRFDIRQIARQCHFGIGRGTGHQLHWLPDQLARRGEPPGAPQGQATEAQPGQAEQVQCLLRADTNALHGAAPDVQQSTVGQLAGGL